MRTQYWIAALLIAAFAAPMLLPGGIQTARADRLADEIARFTTGVGRPPSPAAKDANGWTDLHYAAVLDLPSLAERLLESGATVDARLKSDERPFTDELKATLRRFGKDDDDSWNRYWETPLHHAAYNNAVATATLLVERGAAVNARAEPYGRTSLHITAWKNAVAIATLLLERGAAVNAENDFGSTPLHIAAYNNAVETATLLLERDAAVNAKDHYGRVPLNSAANGNAVETATLLVERGAAVNAKDDNGYTPLHSAARNNAVETATLLLEKGAAVNAKDNWGGTPLAAALYHDADETVALFRRHGGKK